MPTVTLAQIQSLVFERVDNDTLFYSTTQVTNAANEFYRIINAFCGINQQTVSIPGFSVANQLQYAVPAPLLFPMTVSFEGRMLRRLSLGALARNYRSWATDTTPKLGPPQRWAQIGITQFVVHPIDTLGGRDIAVTGLVEPTPLAASDDVIQMEDEYLTALVEYCLHRIQLKEGGKAFGDTMASFEASQKVIRDRSIFLSLKMPRYQVLAGSVR